VPGTPSHSQSSSDAITSLVDALEPVRPVGRTGARSLAWLAFAWLGAISVTLAVGPMRPDALAQLAKHPAFLVESLLGLASGVLLAVGAFALCIPGDRPVRRALPAVSLLVLWAGSYVYALVDPALPGSMLGKRPGCELQVFLLSIPLLCLGLWSARRLVPLYPAVSGGLLGAAAGAIPALLMQFACMYLPTHILSHHMAPVFVLAALGAWLGKRLLAFP